MAIDYHKRFDDRSLMARRRYRQGLFGEFRLGSATLFEKWYYRHSNFQNWCTVERSDAFTYIGCHYVDLVHFITGLLPASVSLCGVRDRYPNGNEGYLWTDARVRWSNGACLNVQNGLSFPDAAPGTNTQGMTLYCANSQTGGLIAHSDQYRGLKYSYVEAPRRPRRDAVCRTQPGLLAVRRPGRAWAEAGRLRLSLDRGPGACGAARGARRRIWTRGSRPCAKSTRIGIVPTPANSRFNEFVIEAGRLSLANDGREALIDYAGTGSVRLRDLKAGVVSPA